MQQFYAVRDDYRLLASIMSWPKSLESAHTCMHARPRLPPRLATLLMQNVLAQILNGGIDFLGVGGEGGWGSCG